MNNMDVKNEVAQMNIKLDTVLDTLNCLVTNNHNVL